MRRVGTARRIVREPDRYYYIWVPVYYSEDTDTYHRVLPAFLTKFKHYTVKTIECSIENNLNLDWYDRPCDSIRQKWNRWFKKNIPVMKLAVPEDSLPETLLNNPVLPHCGDHVEVSAIDYRNDNGWLAVISAAVYNSGLCFQMTFT